MSGPSDNLDDDDIMSPAGRSVEIWNALLFSAGGWVPRGWEVEHFIIQSCQSWTLSVNTSKVNAPIPRWGRRPLSKLINLKRGMKLHYSEVTSMESKSIRNI